VVSGVKGLRADLGSQYGLIGGLHSLSPASKMKYDSFSRD